MMPIFPPMQKNKLMGSSKQSPMTGHYLHNSLRSRPPLLPRLRTGMMYSKLPKQSLHGDVLFLYNKIQPQPCPEQQLLLIVETLTSMTTTLVMKQETALKVYSIESETQWGIALEIQSIESMTQWGIACQLFSLFSLEQSAQKLRKCFIPFSVFNLHTSIL